MKELETAFRRWQGECAYCGVKVEMRPPKQLKPIKATRDHFIPRAKGGADGAGNIVLACHGCNAQKGGLDPRSILKVWLRLAPASLADEISRLLETTRPLPRAPDARPLPLFSVANQCNVADDGAENVTRDGPA